MSRCGLCSTEIAVPVCPLCLTDKIEFWIERRKLSLVRAYKEEVRNILDRTRYGKISCRICRGENEKALCLSCFAGRVYNWLAIKDQALAADFAKAFTFSAETARSKIYA